MSTVPFSIIIPTLNEAVCIGSQVARCLTLVPRPEILVVDGGSSDGTGALAERAGARVIASDRPGRASQMNAGADASSGQVLIFLHADVILSQQSYAALASALRDRELLGGAFRRRFDSPSRWLDLGCRLADARGRWLRIYLGDQAMFVRRQIFSELGGFPKVLLFEDVALSRELRRRGRTRLIEEPVLASSRRFDREGPLRRLSRNVWLTTLYLLGADPDRLARRYYPGFYTDYGAETPDGGSRWPHRPR